MKQVTITINLGSGERGELRKQALMASAALAGYSYNGKPSIGRWITSLADEWIDQIYEAIKSQKGTEHEI